MVRCRLLKMKAPITFNRWLIFKTMFEQYSALYTTPSMFETNKGSPPPIPLFGGGSILEPGRCSIPTIPQSAQCSL